MAAPVRAAWRQQMGRRYWQHPAKWRGCRHCRYLNTSTVPDLGDSSGAQHMTAHNTGLGRFHQQMADGAASGWALDSRQRLLHACWQNNSRPHAQPNHEVGE